MQPIEFGTLTPKRTRLAIAVAVIAMTHVLTGCGHSSDKVANKEKSGDSNLSQKAEALDCTSPAIASVIQQTTQNQISQQATTNVQQLAGQAGIANTHIDISHLVSQMNIAVTDTTAIAGQSDQCQANIAVTLPDSVLTKANQIATSLNQPTVAQNLATKGLNLEKTTITAINAGFKITPSGDSYKATPSNGSSTASVLMSEVGNLVANAQLAQLIGTGSTTPTLQSANPTNSTITNEPTNGSSTNSSTANVTTDNAISNTSPQTTTSNTPMVASPVTTSANKQTNNTSSTVVKKTTTTTTYSEKSHTATPKKVEKPVTHTHEQKAAKATSTKTTKDYPSEKSTIKDSTHTRVKKVPADNESDTKLGPAAEMGPAAKPKSVPKPVADDEVKLTIEEKNEKY